MASGSAGGARALRAGGFGEVVAGFWMERAGERRQDEFVETADWNRKGGTTKHDKRGKIGGTLRQ